MNAVPFAVARVHHVRNRTHAIHIEDSSNGKRNVLLGFDYGQLPRAGSETRQDGLRATFSSGSPSSWIRYAKALHYRAPATALRANACAPQRANVGIELRACLAQVFFALLEESKEVLAVLEFTKRHRQGSQLLRS